MWKIDSITFGMFYKIGEFFRYIGLHRVDNAIRMFAFSVCLSTEEVAELYKEALEEERRKNKA